MVLSIEEAYRILGVTSSNTAEEIKTAYKRLALKTHPDKNKSENAHEMFQKVSEAYKRITDPDSFKDEDAEMNDEDLNEMFHHVFAEMMNLSGASGFGDFDGIPLSFLDMMMAQEMDMGGMGFFDEDDDDDEDMDGEEHSHMMHSFAAMMAGGMHGHPGMMDSDDEEGYEDEEFDDDLTGITPQQLQQLMMQDLLMGGGMGMGMGPMGGMDFDEDMLMEAMRGMGMSSHGPNKSSKKTKNIQISKKNTNNSNVAKKVEWQTDSSEDDNEDDDEAYKSSSKKTGSNSKKNKRKARNKKLKKAMEKEGKTTDPSSSINASNTTSTTTSTTTSSTSNNSNIPGKVNTDKKMSSNDINAKKNSSTTTTTTAKDKDNKDIHVVVDDEEMREMMSALRTRKSPGVDIPSSSSSSTTPSTSTSNKIPLPLHNNNNTRSYSIGDRIQLIGKGKQQGTVAFIGPVHYAEGVYMGVVMDQPLGKNNGTIKGKKYFSCSADKGLMLRADDVTLVAAP
eukprot:gene7628-15615_t